jgi:hypothetical protein
VVAWRSGKETAEDDEARDNGGFEQNNLQVLAVHEAAVYRRRLKDRKNKTEVSPIHGDSELIVLNKINIDCCLRQAGKHEVYQRYLRQVNARAADLDSRRKSLQHAACDY